MKHPLCLLGRHAWVTLFYRVPPWLSADEWGDIEGCTRCRVNQHPGMAYYTADEFVYLAAAEERAAPNR